MPLIAIVVPKEKLFMHEAALNKKIALIAWAKDENDDDDVAVFAGIFEKGNNGYYINRGADEPPFEVQEEWLPRIKKVEQEQSEMLLNAEYQLSLSVGSVESKGGPLVKTGLKWPQ